MGSFFIDLLLSNISPSLNSKIPTIHFRVVVLPAPLCPTKAQMSPSASSTFKFLTT